MSEDYISEANRAHPARSAVRFAAVLCLAVAAELGPWPAFALAFKPDFPALALVYCGIHAPRLGGFAAAFVVGLMMDLARQTPLGFTPVCYAVMMLSVEWLRGRFALLGPFGRGVHVFFILAAGQMTAYLLTLTQNPEAPLSWRHFLPSVSGGFLWLALPLAARQIQKRARGERHPIGA